MEKIENEDFEQEEKIGKEQEFDNETEEILELTEEQEQDIEGGASAGGNKGLTFKTYRHPYSVLDLTKRTQ